MLRLSKYFALYVILLFIIITLMITVVFSQPRTGNNNINGKVFDSETMNPIPFAVVFLKNTTIGVSADSSGNFEIKNVPSGEYEIVFSQAGYVMQAKKISLYDGGSHEYNVYLNPKIVSVGEVEVVAHASEEWKENLAIFTREFLGTTLNSSKCRIMNPEVIDFFNDFKTNVFKAATDSTIIIENQALGYKIYLHLVKFIYDKKINMINYHFYPRYVELKTGDPEDIDNWKGRRVSCYKGSFRHFLKSLLKNQLESDGYVLYGGGNIECLRKKISRRISYDSIGIIPNSDTNFYEVKFGLPSIEVLYFAGANDYSSSGKLISMFEMKSDKFLISRYGELIDYDKTLKYGYWSMLRLADSLPLDYEFIDK